MKKKALAIGAVATAAVLAGGWALAQPMGFGPGGFGPGGFGPGRMMGMRGPMHGPMGPWANRSGFGPGFGFISPARLDALKTELGITTAQEPAWTGYAKAVEGAAAAMRTAREGVNPATIGTLGPQQRFAFAAKMREQAQKQHDAVRAAADNLLAALNAEQKAKAQQMLPGLAFGPGPMNGAFAGGPPFRR